MRELIEYRERHVGQPLWVAEIDLASCFDCISRRVAEEEMEKAVARAARRGAEVDKRALAILRSYVHGYSFLSVALPRAQEWFDVHDPEGRLVWPRAQLAQHWSDLDAEPIGIPQGGALSGVILDTVLHAVDLAVVTDSDEELFYRRYADDILLIHPQEAVLHAAFDRCLRALERLHLPYHPPAPDRRYGKYSWDGKTKGPYRWMDSRASAASPWLGFLGYQVRHDGFLRIRASSVKKEMEAQRERVSRTIHLVRRHRDLLTPSFRDPHPGDRIILRAVRQMTAHAIVRPRLGGHRRCFCAGFRLLCERPHDRRQIRALDRHFEAEVRRLIREVGRLVPISPKAARRARRRRSWRSSYAYSFARRD